jgi:hypothetical protein
VVVAALVELDVLPPALELVSVVLVLVPGAPPAPP